MTEDGRLSLLHGIAKIYVEEGLGKGNFDAIPYAEDLILRAPLNPGGSEQALTGRENIRNSWWAPLPQLVDSTTFLDSYTNQDLSAVTVEFYCDIKEPSCRLRIVDRFRVDADGQITEQENFFDPRALTG